MESTVTADLLAQPTRARLFALLQARRAAADTAELAAAVGLHPNGVRAHLEQLHTVGLVTRTRTPQPRGRPRDMWAVAAVDAGRPAGPAVPPAAAPPTPAIDGEYGRLAELRAGLRSYLAWAEERARDHGLTAAQFQLALAIRASSDPAGPTLTELADALLLRHHSVAGLVDRAQDGGLVERVRNPDQPSRVHVRLTASGTERFRVLADLHLAELAELAPYMQALWGAFGP